MRMADGCGTLVSLMIVWGLAVPGLGAQDPEVRGQVVDVRTDAAIATVLVELLEERDDDAVVSSVVTDHTGRFRLQAPTSGTYRLRAERIGYHTITTSPFDLTADDDPLQVEVLLGVEAVVLAPLVILSERPARIHLGLHSRGFYERRRGWGREGSGFGHFLDRSDIERRNAFSVIDLLRDVPGVRIESRGGRRPGEITLRAVTSIRDQGFRCSPVIFVDGVPAATGAPDRSVPGVNPGAHIDELVSVAGIAGIEVYPGLTQPARFQRGNNCGVIAVWTGGGS